MVFLPSSVKITCRIQAMARRHILSNVRKIFVLLLALLIALTLTVPAFA